MSTRSLSPARQVSVPIKRFFANLGSPSPLAWVIIGGLSYTTTKVLGISLIALLFFVPGIYALFVGIPRSVTELKRLAIDATPPLEYHFWQGLRQRVIRSDAQFELVSLLSLVGSTAMLVPIISEAITRQPASLWMLIVCGVAVTLGLFARAILFWYLDL